MAESSITISRTPPDFKSMRYDFLREEGLKHIQNLAGKVWTDYNLSDPGISILEVLSYVITDLGYRTSYPVKDIIAQDPDEPQVDIRNFYTARQILPMYPVTFNDYRKLLIDCDVHDPSDIGCPIVGVKNAWIEISEENERHFFVQRALDKLDYTEEVPGDERVKVKVLYDVLLELDKCEKYGDLNENTMEGIVTIGPGTNIPPIFSGVKLKVNVEFPRWDDPDIDWNDEPSIREHIKRLTLVFPKLPAGYSFDDYGLLPDKSAWLSIIKLPNSPFDPSSIATQVNDLIYAGASSLIKQYQAKVKKILQIIATVKARMMANRNLCEDLFRINALKVEEIAVCADVELSADADVEDALAKIYFEIGKFLAPTVYFYSLDEMFEKGKRSEEIFEGPPLQHGFIDENELQYAERRKVIHVSDLIRIIMDVPGVVAVKSIQIANIPEDNDDHIPSRSVRWCLDLAFAKNYVPRLSTELSKITFFKDLLPFKANEDEVDAQLKALEAAARPQKLENPVLDLPVPQGEYRAIEEYVSTQDEFPLVYGIGPEGLSDSETDLRKAQAKQMKGFLMFFDQLLADYLSQLANVKELFSMNEERDAYGNFIVDKSYFSQSLVPSVTDANSLLVDATLYPEHLQNITEDAALFDKRRNKFLDHLLARFSEQFTDYALLVYKLTGKKAAKELLIDKLEVLNAYPEISGGRFKAFNYESPCDLWSVNNVSGLEKRISLLTGIAPRLAASLNFNANFKMIGTVPALTFEVWDSTPVKILKSPPAVVYDTIDNWKKAVEKVVVNGVNPERYNVVPFSTGFVYQVICAEGTVLGVSHVIYPTEAAAKTDIPTVIDVLSDEFYNNVESNRNNLASPIANYFKVTQVSPYPDMVPDPPVFTFDFELYRDPFDFGTPNLKLLTGSYTGQGKAKESIEIISVDTASNSVVISGDFTGRINTTTLKYITIKDSDLSDGNYTVALMNVTSLGGGVYETKLKLTGATLSASVPLGTLYYNVETAQELLDFANASQESILFDIIVNGIHEENYTFNSASGSYRFNIADRCKDTLATSVEDDFNDAMAAITASHPGPSYLFPPLAANYIRIAGNDPGNDGDHQVLSAAADEDTVIVNVPPPTLSAVSGGNIIFDGSIPVISANRFTRTFTVSGVYNRILFSGEIISIKLSDKNDGNYTIVGITTDGVNSEIRVEENIHDNTPGLLGDIYYVKSFEIIEIIQLGTAGADIVFRPGAGLQAVKEMTEFINSKFFGHEGLHLAEHILLRPKVKQEVFIPMVDGVNSLDTGLTIQGNLEYTKHFAITGIDTANNAFIIGTNVVTELTPLMKIRVEGAYAGLNDGEYQVQSFGPSGSGTSIIVLQTIPLDKIPFGELRYQRTVPITTTGDTSVFITEKSSEIFWQNQVTITGSQDGINDGEYKIKLAPSGSGTIEIEFSEVLTYFQDDLLPINLNDECGSCRIEDPYSFIASVVMPYWQGRFINQDFRGFFERSLQLECPAHIALNICWVSYDHMKEFELKYKKWLVENSKIVKDLAALSIALNELIDILVRLRTVYPGGTLHDCASDDTLQNSVILNRTALGTIQI
ncbi:MAG: hypothetical protein JWO09_2785 [Bacteroidetes bacterium]|nr:hypothetical protein [Bacteroidota bacterium]